MSSAVPETRWFTLSTRELMALCVCVGIALVAVGAARLLRGLNRPEPLSFTEGASALGMPARLDVNTAAEYELMMLPGIGPKTARAIVESRETDGAFHSLDDLGRVRGVAQKTVEALRPYAMCRQD